MFTTAHKTVKDLRKDIDLNPRPWLLPFSKVTTYQCPHIRHENGGEVVWFTIFYRFRTLRCVANWRGVGARTCLPASRIDIAMEDFPWHNVKKRV